MSDYKPVNDRTINDVNEANRRAWDSGEFRHTPDKGWATEIARQTGYESGISKPSRAGAEVQEAHRKSSVAKAETLGTLAASHAHEGTEHKARIAATLAAHEGKKALGQDVVHTPEGGQQVVRGGQIVSHHDEGDAELKTGQKMRFNGRSVSGNVEGSMPVSVVNPHSNAHQVTHTKGGREYEGAFSHIRTATVERPAHKERPAKQFEAHHHTLSSEDVVKDDQPEGATSAPKKQVHMPRKANKTWRKGEWS